MINKLNHTIVFFGFFLACVQANAQNGIINYKLTIKSNKDSYLSGVENYVCYFADSKSIEFFQPSQIKESTVQTGDNSVIRTIVSSSKSKKKTFIYKDFNNKTLLLGDNIEFKKYLINDTLANFKWKITNEHKKILKYNCTKATTNFRGRDYVAWFTDDIPIQNGPWKFCGLPGLIVKVNDLENSYVFELESIDLKMPFDISIISLPEAYANDVAISHKSFIEMYKKKVSDLDASNRASFKTTNMGSGTMTSRSNDSILGKIEKF